MGSFEETFSVLELQARLWQWIGLDHRQRDRLRLAWRQHDPNPWASNPTFYLKAPDFHVSGTVVPDPYSVVYERARERHRQYLEDTRFGRPPVDDTGRPVYFGWDRVTGLPRPHPYWENQFAMGGRVWVSPHRALPLRTAYSDPRYWRGDAVLSHGDFFPDAAPWPPCPRPHFIPAETTIGFYHGRFPDPAIRDGRWIWGHIDEIRSIGIRGDRHNFNSFRFMPVDPRH